MTFDPLRALTAGLFGGIPWNAMAFLPMYWQTCGYSDGQTGMLGKSSWVLCCAVFVCVCVCTTLFSVYRSVGFSMSEWILVNFFTSSKKCV